MGPFLRGTWWGWMSGCESQACHHLVSFWPPSWRWLWEIRLTISSFMCSLSVWLILDCHRCKCRLMAVGLVVCVLVLLVASLTTPWGKARLGMGFFRSSPGSQRCPFPVHYLETHLGLLAYLGGHYKCFSCCPASPPNVDSQCHLHVK